MVQTNNATNDSNVIRENKKKIRDIICEDPNGEILVSFAEQYGKDLAQGEKKITRSQIRNIYSEARKIDLMQKNMQENASANRRLILLKPKLAYLVGKSSRNNKPGLTAIQEILSEAVDQVAASNYSEKAYKRFMDLFEAILAFHRAYGGE